MTHYHGGTDWQEGGGEGPEPFKPTDLFGCDPDFKPIPSDYQLGYADALVEARDAVAALNHGLSVELDDALAAINALRGES